LNDTADGAWCREQKARNLSVGSGITIRVERVIADWEIRGPTPAVAIACNDRELSSLTPVEIDEHLAEAGAGVLDDASRRAAAIDDATGESDDDDAVNTIVNRGHCRDVLSGCQ
jgi:hypothetical protein